MLKLTVNVYQNNYCHATSNKVYDISKPLRNNLEYSSHTLTHTLAHTNTSMNVHTYTDALTHGIFLLWILSHQLLSVHGPYIFHSYLPFQKIAGILAQKMCRGFRQGLSQRVQVPLSGVTRRLSYEFVVLWIRHVQGVIHNVFVHRQEERDIANIVNEGDLFFFQTNKSAKML